MSPAFRAPLRLVPPPGAERERAGFEPSIDDSTLLAGLKARDASISSAFYARARPILDRTLTRTVKNQRVAAAVLTFSNSTAATLR